MLFPAQQFGTMAPEYMLVVCSPLQKLVPSPNNNTSAAVLMPEALLRLCIRSPASLLSLLRQNYTSTFRHLDRPHCDPSILCRT